MPSMRAMVGELCGSVEENTIADVYAEIWGDPGRVDFLQRYMQCQTTPSSASWPASPR